MPRSPDQNDAIRALTRAKILGAALLLFARHGYANTSVKAIAAEAGIASGLLYSHFPGKEGLLRALFEESMADVRASFAIAESVEPKDRVAALVRGTVAILRSHLDFWRLGYQARMQPAVMSVLGSALDDWMASIIATLTAFLGDRGGREPEIDAHALFAQIDGMCQHFALRPDEYPIDAIAERVIARWTTPEPVPFEPG